MSSISNFFNTGGVVSSVTVTTGAGENLTANDVVSLNEEKVKKFVANDTLSSGTAVVYEEAQALYTSITMLTSTKAIVIYRDGGNSNYGTACILDISGSTITPGTPAVFESAVTNVTSVAALSSTKAIVTYQDGGNSDYGTACILDISGSTITPGTPAVFESANSNYTSVAALSSTKAIVTYQDGGNSSYGTACILDISGSTITPGTPAVFESAATYYMSVTMLSSSKALVAYRDGGNSNYGTACILDISGSTITPGSASVFESAATNFTSVDKLSATKAIVVYEDDANSDFGTVCELNVSGSAITPGTPAVFESAAVGYTAVAALSEAKAIVAYQDEGNSYYGTACVISPIYTPQICGIANSTVNTDDDISITIDGIKGGFSSLSIGYSYYVDDSGDLTTTPTDNYLGKAISTTEIALNGGDFLLKNMEPA